MTLATKKRKFWTCPRCSHRNEATRSRKCQSCGELSRPKKRRRKHAEVLSTVSYEQWARISVEIHGGELYACGVCGKPPGERGTQDRDHDHRTGRVRGLACPGNTGCNYLMLPWVTAATAGGIALAKLHAGEPDALRWMKITEYLGRVEAYWREQDEQVSRLDDVSADCTAD